MSKSALQTEQCCRIEVVVSLGIITVRPSI
jgi:hypothetical protein